MPFLTINGVTVPTAFGGEAIATEIGEKLRTYDGTYYRERRAVKRTWAFQTVPLVPADAIGFRGLLSGLGIHLPLESDAYSTSGLIPVFEDAIEYDAPVAVDGDAVEMLSTSPATAYSFLKRGSYAAVFSDNKSNLLTSDQSDMEGTGTSGWVGAGIIGSLAVDTAHKWQGSQSLKFVTSVQAISVAQITYTPAVSTTYCWSCYVKRTTGSTALTIDMYDNDGGNGSFTFNPPTTNTWYRVFCYCTTGAAATTLTCRIRDGGFDPAQTIWLDGAQLEVGNTPTRWMDGGTSRSTETRLQADPGRATLGRGVTMSGWFTCNSPDTSSFTRQLMGLRIDGVTRLYVYLGTTPPNQINVRLGGVGYLDTVNSGQYTIPGKPVMVTVTYDRPTATCKIYTDGVLRVTNTTMHDFDLPASVTFNIGNVFSGGQVLDGTAEDVLLLPFVASEGIIADLYSGFAAITLPHPTMSGDVVGGEEIPVIGWVDKETIAGHQTPTGWESAARVLNFTLMER